MPGELVADEIVNAATAPQEVARGAVMRVGTVEGDGTRTRIGNVAEYVYGLSRQGKMSATVKAELDRTRRAAESLTGKPDPTVDEMLRLVPALRQYLSEPPYGSKARPVGNAQEWALLTEKRRASRKYAEETNKPASVAEWLWYSQVDKDGANLIRKYQIVGPNPERARILGANKGLERLIAD